MGAFRLIAIGDEMALKGIPIPPCVRAAILHVPSTSIVVAFRVRSGQHWQVNKCQNMISDRDIGRLLTQRYLGWNLFC